MRSTIIVLALAMAAATPVFAKTAPAAAEPDHTGPIPYSDLAAVDAKMNMAPKAHMKKHMAKKAAAAPAAAAGADASAKTPAK